MFFERLAPSPLPTMMLTEESALSDTHHYAKLATTIQQYGHMYYHFVVETLPKLVLLKEVLDEDEEIKLLVWGKEHEKMVSSAFHLQISHFRKNFI